MRDISGGVPIRSKESRLAPATITTLSSVKVVQRREHCARPSESAESADEESATAWSTVRTAERGHGCDKCDGRVPMCTDRSLMSLN